MGQTANWKPCDRLTAADFKRHPVWTFDLSHEGDEGSDETWVRPVGVDGFNSIEDELFVGAVLTLADGSKVPGCLTMRLASPNSFSRPRVAGAEISGVALLKPRYKWVGPADSRGAITYSATLILGKKSFPLQGSL